MALGRLRELMLIASMLLSTSRAWGEAPIELVYLRSGKAEACSDKATLEKAVAKRLGYQPFFAAAQRKLIAEISSKGSTLQARATLVDQGGVVRGTRQLTAPAGDCAELIASLALAISITLDPMSSGTPEGPPPVESRAASPPNAGAERPPEPAPLPTSSDEEKPPPSALPSAVADTAPSRIDAATVEPVSAERSTDFTANAGVSALIGALPQVSPAFSGGLELALKSASLGIEILGTPSATQLGPLGSHAELSLLLGSVVPCASFGRVGACGVMSLGSLRGAGFNVQEAKVSTQFYAAAGLRMFVVFPLARWLDLRVHAGSGLTMTRPTFELVGVEVWRPPLLAADAGATLSVHFL